MIKIQSAYLILCYSFCIQYIPGDGNSISLGIFELLEAIPSLKTMFCSIVVFHNIEYPTEWLNNTHFNVTFIKWQVCMHFDLAQFLTMPGLDVYEKWPILEKGSLNLPFLIDMKQTLASHDSCSCMQFSSYSLSWIWLVIFSAFCIDKHLMKKAI